MAKKRTLTIKVTKKHIKQGKPHSGERCPIALALIEQGFTDVNVDYSVLKFSEELVSPRLGKVRVDYDADMPERGSNFVRDFDDGDAVKPLTLVVRDIAALDKESIF